jgi:hypothetical protein
MAMDELRESIRRTLRENVLGEDYLAEAKSSGAGGWWDGMSRKSKGKVVSVLGLSKGKDKVSFSKLSPGEQSEVDAYFMKHRGKVEGVE